MAVGKIPNRHRRLDSMHDRRVIRREQSFSSQLFKSKIEDRLGNSSQQKGCVVPQLCCLDFQGPRNYRRNRWVMARRAPESVHGGQDSKRFFYEVSDSVKEEGICWNPVTCLYLRGPSIVDFTYNGKRTLRHSTSHTLCNLFFPSIL